MNKEHCRGCGDDFYNSDTSLGVTECWMFGGAKLVERVRVHVDQRPPWDQKPVTVPDCFQMDRHIHVEPDNPSCKAEEAR